MSLDSLDSSGSAQYPITPVINGDKVTIKSRLLLLTVVIFFVAVVLAFAGGFYFSKKGFMVSPNDISETVDIPLPYNNPAVYRASFVYAFKAKVVALEEKSGKAILKTDLADVNNLPEFVIDEETKIAVVQNGIETKIKGTKPLTPGTPIYVYLAYNLVEKKWLTTRIAIVRPDITRDSNSLLLVASSSAKIKTAR